MALMIFLSVNISSYATLVEARVLYFQPTDKDFKDIYGSGMSFGGEVTIKVLNGLNVWIGAEYFTKKGELTFTKEETEIRIFPIFAGIKYILPSPKFKPYAGIGVGYFQYKESNPIGTVEESKIGFVTQTGLLIPIFGPALLDLQVGYNICKIKPQELEANIGGFKAGLGLAISF